jgi:pimeloyl-ACP methyl ester carboxylesterase
MAKFVSDDLSIHYDVAGNGPPIVLIHGFASNTQGNWRAPGWIDFLKDAGMRVVTLDCRGHGQSDKPYGTSAYGGHRMAEDVIHLMDHLNIEQAAVMGYSMGARITAQLMVSHPQRFGMVILGGIGSSIFHQRGKRNRDIGAALLAEKNSPTDNPIARGFRLFAETTGADLRALAAVIQSTSEPIEASDLAGITAPTLVVVGDKDELVGDPGVLAAAIPGCQLVILKDQDHLSAVMDPAFKEAVGRFLHLYT